MVVPIFNSRFIGLGIMVTLLIEAITCMIAFLPLNALSDHRVYRRLQLYMIWACSAVLCVSIGTLGNNVFRKVKFSFTTGLWIFIVLLAGLVQVVHVLTANIYPNFFISLCLVATNEVLIFMFIICVSQCHSALEEWKREQQELLLELHGPPAGTSHGSTTYFIPLQVSEDYLHQEGSIQTDPNIHPDTEYLTSILSDILTNNLDRDPDTTTILSDTTSVLSLSDLSDIFY